MMCYYSYMLIRTLNESDIEQAIALEADVYEYVSGGPLITNNRFNHWFQTIDQELTVGMFDHDKLVGLAYACDQSPGNHIESTYKRDSLIIHPDYHGKGLGEKLFETILAMVDCSSPHQSSHSYIGDDNDAMKALNCKFRAQTSPNAHSYNEDGRQYRAWSREPFTHILQTPDPSV
jgi:GNAT superfamily N-acetyltransferase